MAGWEAALSAVPRSEAAVRHTRGIRAGDRVPEEAREAGMTAHHPLGEEIQDFADARLTPARREDLERHLATCPQCSRELERLRWAKQGTAHLPMHEPPPDLPARIAQALDNEDRRGSHASPLRRYLLPAAGVLAAAAPETFRARWGAISRPTGGRLSLWTPRAAMGRRSSATSRGGASRSEPACSIW